MLNIKDYIDVNPEILSGNPVFKGTRVPVDSLFLHLEKGLLMEEFLDDFPTVSRQQALAILDIASIIFSSKNILSIYDSAA